MTTAHILSDACQRTHTGEEMFINMSLQQVRVEVLVTYRWSSCRAKCPPEGRLRILFMMGSDCTGADTVSTPHHSDYPCTEAELG